MRLKLLLGLTVIVPLLSPVAMAGDKTSDVRVVNQVDVSITNPVVPVEVTNPDSPGRGERYLYSQTTNFSYGTFSRTVNVTPTIPAGKRLVLQKVSIHTLLSDDQAVMEAKVSVGGVQVGWVPQEFQAAGTQQRHYGGSIDLNVSVFEGESISIFVFRNGDLGDASVNFFTIALIGYLVD